METPEYQSRKMDSTELVRYLPLLPKDQILQYLDPGSAVDFSVADGLTRDAVVKYFGGLRPTKKWQLGYTVIFMKNYSEIQLHCKDPSNNFKWKFMDSELFHESENNANREPKVHTYGVSSANNAARAAHQLRRIRDVFPALIGKMVVYSGALINKSVAREIGEIKRVKFMYVEGKGGEVSKNYDILLKNIKVLDRLDVWEFSGKKALKPKKIVQIPYARLTLQSAPAPEKLFKVACDRKKLSIAKGPKDLCNSLIRCWLKSDRKDMNFLTVEITKFTKDNTGLFDGLFDGMKFVKGTRVCSHSDSEQPINEWGCFKLILLHEGVEILRKDGATLCLFYKPLSKGANFTLIADYPGNSTRAEKMEEYCDQFARLIGRPDTLEEYNFRRQNNKRSSDWVEENKHLLDAAEIARHDRFQAADPFRDALETSKEWIANAEANDLRLEIISFFQAEGRKAYGHFELAKKSKFRFF